MEQKIIEKLSLIILKDFNQIAEKHSNLNHTLYFCYTIKEMTANIDNEYEEELLDNYLFDIVKIRRGICFSFLYNFIITHYKNINCQKNKWFEFKKAYIENLKVLESSKHVFDKIKYWKGIDYYLEKLN